MDKWQRRDPSLGVSQCHYQQKLDPTSLYFTSLNLTSLQVYEQEGGVKVCSKRKKEEKKSGGSKEAYTYASMFPTGSYGQIDHGLLPVSYEQRKRR